MLRFNPRRIFKLAKPPEIPLWLPFVMGVIYYLSHLIKNPLETIMITCCLISIIGGLIFMIEKVPESSNKDN